RFLQHRTRPDAGKRPDDTGKSYLSVLDYTIARYHGTAANTAILQFAAGPDTDFVTEYYDTLQHHIDVYFHVAPGCYRPPNIGSCRIPQGYTRQHQSPGFHGLEMAFQFCQLQPVVDARHFLFVGTARRRHPAAIGQSELHHISEVV